jgi:hypothetical protein
MSGSQQLLLGGAAAAAPAVDPFFYSVTSLLHGDGTNGAQNNTFLDSSTNNFTITRNGNTTQGSFSPFSQTGWGNFFDGTGDYLSAASNAAFALPGAFTFECWFYPRSFDQTASWGDTIFTTTATNGIVIARPTSGTSNTWGVGQVGVAWIILSSTLPTNNQWNHIVVVRDSSNNISLFLNGARLGTTTSSASFAQAAVTIGSDNNAADSFIDGYLSNLRLVKGTAVYDPTATTLTVPTTPLTAITNTSLLTCQANRFLDASTNAFAITRNGDVSVQPFSPFNPTTAYSTSAVGGSGYFDGSGDYLTVPDNAAFDFGSGDFTISAWVYPQGAGGIIDQGGGGASSNRSFEIYMSSASSISNAYISSDGTYQAGYNLTGTTVPNAWNFVEFTRASGTLRLFVNGVQQSSVSANVTIFNSTATVAIGNTSENAVNPYTGYISDVRVLKGTGSATSTVPTAPLTAIANTSLLCNFTNAGIFDNAAVADYETVGNAQISTSVKKYGTGSMAFDGSGDRLFSPSNRQWNFGTGDFTIELWAYPTSQGGHGSSNNDCLIDFRPGTNGVYGTLYIFNSGTGVYWFVNSANRITGAAIPNNQWTHIAICRIASQTKLFINGTQSGATYADTNNYLVAPAMIGEFNDGVGGGNFQGYIDDLRISRFGRYPYNFTPPTAEFPNIGGTVTLTADPYFDYTTLLLPGNGTNGAQNNTFLDSSTNNFTITRNGNTTQGTFSPFSQTGWGNYFDGAAATRLTMPSNTAFAFGTGAYTVEGWVYLNAQAATQSSFFEAGTNTGALSTSILNNGAVSLGTYGVGAVFSSSANSVTPNQWFHVAVVRNSTASNDTKIYVNGTAVATGTDSSNWTVTTTPAIGGINLSGYTLNGYISNLRVVKGTAVYTATFTVPTTPLTAISGTSLLTCQSNRFVDNSSNAFAITRNGDVSVQAFSPFNPTAAWSAATNGGSGYFDGSGDYLNGPSTGQFAPTGDFTISMWIYPTSFAASFYVLAGSWAGAGAANEWLIQYDNTGAIRFLTTTDSTFSAAGVIKLNQWQFLSISRTGSTLTGYVNGTSFRSYTLTGTVGSATKVVYIGIQSGTTWPYIGYMADFRMVAGSAESATPPTSPATAISGTNMLLNFTNAGILDATSKNDLETVGNAQISTTQSKFGGSSMYFDGTDDRLPAAANNDLVFGTGDFTVEGWFYTGVPANNRGLFQISSTAGGLEGGNTNNVAVYCSSSVLGVYYNDTFKAGTTAISSNTWTHFALVKYSGNIKLYVNGIADSGFGTNSDTRNYTGKNICVGGYFSTSFLWSGYIQDFRITKGIARYTSNFTPPTTAFLTL